MATVTCDGATRLYPGNPVAAVDSPAMNLLTLDVTDGGVHPEDLELSDRGLPVRVDVVEELGADACTYGSLAQLGKQDHQVIARVDGRRPPEKGSTVHFTPQAGHVHLFDQHSGRRVAA
ncbi:TOBE domain-containing protein [Kineococcus arenarius]|uniref:TOBE domain-containing protein n=1 Tax=unclassified Kineococcus TaxID=2621656 RepID=UPI003D7E1071